MNLPHAMPRARGHARTDFRREIILTHSMAAITAVAVLLAYAEIAAIGAELAHARDWTGVAGQLVFAGVFGVFAYSYAVYMITRVGQLRRRREHIAAADCDLDELFGGAAPSLAVLVPAYKEEPDVVRRTLLSAAFQLYPRRSVVLLIDDPYHPQGAADAANLAAMRALPRVLQALVDPVAESCARAQRGFIDRCLRGTMEIRSEAAALVRAYEDLATWFDRQIADYPVRDHADRLFVERVLGACGDAHRARATAIARAAASQTFVCADARREYRRLAALFRVTFSSFERKRYENLSHESNKAMNLNSYIGLMGRSFREVPQGDGRDAMLEEAPRGPGTLDFADAELLLTLDADSVLLPEYALRLAHLMSVPANERVAVAQTPYSAFPGAPGVLERMAGATTDIQYLVHQGFTRFSATFWVGANALLRKAALEDICTLHQERGYPVRKYIHDRTVIEDTESSIDLAARGWTLQNYPERLAYSATPPDFGSLLIQRRRWANGGLIILPKALRYLSARTAGWRALGEAACRVHYLTSIAIVNVALLMILFGWFERNARIVWLIVASLPYMFLYARDLVACGYRASDFLRVYALNILLVPVHMAGTLKSLHHAATGKRTPFARTPKVSGRTAAHGMYIVAEYALLGAAAAMVVANALAGTWISAGFAFAYVLFCGYAIARFVGVRASLDDLRLWLHPPAPTPMVSLAVERAAVQLPLPPVPFPDPAMRRRRANDALAGTPAGARRRGDARSSVPDAPAPAPMPAPEGSAAGTAGSAVKSDAGR